MQAPHIRRYDFQEVGWQHRLTRLMILPPLDGYVVTIPDRRRLAAGGRGAASLGTFLKSFPSCVLRPLFVTEHGRDIASSHPQLDPVMERVRAENICCHGCLILGEQGGSFRHVLRVE